MHRLVETVVLVQTRELLLGDVELGPGAPSRGRHLPTSARSGELHAQLVDLATRDELKNHERDQGDPDEGRDHEQKPPDHIVA